MREILEEAHKHQDDGYGRAQHHTQQTRMKRFYKDVSVGEVDGGYAVLLDKRPTKTPSKKPAVVPSQRLATLLANEWSAQVETIDQLSMPLVRLANAAIEGGAETAPALRGEIIKFSGNDLLLFRSESPRELVELQEKFWDDALTKLARHFEVRFQPVVGIIHLDQPESTLEKLTASLDLEEHFSLTALTSITGLTGSGLLAIAIRNGLLDADTVWQTAHVDEDYNVKNWGEDFEAAARRATRRKEFDAAVAMLSLVAEIPSS